MDEIIKAYEDYIKLLEEELGDVLSFAPAPYLRARASISGKEQEAREKIEHLKLKYKNDWK